MNLLAISREILILQIHDEKPDEGPEVGILNGVATSCTCGPWRQQGSCKHLAATKAVLEKEGLKGIVKVVRKSQREKE
jgi:hypothetical protein